MKPDITTVGTAVRGDLGMKKIGDLTTAYLQSKKVIGRYWNYDSTVASGATATDPTGVGTTGVTIGQFVTVTFTAQCYLTTVASQSFRLAEGVITGLTPATADTLPNAALYDTRYPAQPTALPYHADCRVWRRIYKATAGTVLFRGSVVNAAGAALGLRGLNYDMVIGL